MQFFVHAIAQSILILNRMITGIIKPYRGSPKRDILKGIYVLKYFTDPTVSPS